MTSPGLQHLERVLSNIEAQIADKEAESVTLKGELSALYGVKAMIKNSFDSAAAEERAAGPK